MILAKNKEGELCLIGNQSLDWYTDYQPIKVLSNLPIQLRRLKVRDTLKDIIDKQFKCFPIGMLQKVTDICNEFAEHYQKELKIVIKDSRDQDILNYKQQVMPKKLNTDKTLRPYQFYAINTFLEKEMGIINIATGGGKMEIKTTRQIASMSDTYWVSPLSGNELLNLETKKWVAVEDILTWLVENEFETAEEELKEVLNIK